MQPPKCIIPLFLATSSETFIQWGSAILYEYQKKPFLVTAAHVVDGLEGNSDLLMLSPKAQLIPIPQKWQLTSFPTGKTRKDDKMDIAVSILDDDIAVGMIQLGFGFLGETTMDAREITKLDKLVYVGYPFNNQTCTHFQEGSLVQLQPVAFHTHKVSNPEIEGLGFSADHHIVAELNISRSNPLPSQKPDTPMPPGMSGGMVLRYENDQPAGFVGVIHRWTDPGYLIGTRSYALIQILDAAITENTTIVSTQ